MGGNSSESEGSSSQLYLAFKRMKVGQQTRKRYVFNYCIIHIGDEILQCIMFMQGAEPFFVSPAKHSGT